MEVKVLRECGYEEAMRGMAYSYHDRALPVETWWASQMERAEKRIKKLAHMDGGHNKALESIQVWIDLEACRAFWSEFDTYRVGTTKQSESTMHTLSKREPMIEDFEEGTHHAVITTFRQVFPHIKHDVTKLKQALPEGFLQRRIVNTNYKVLRNILFQRRDHRLIWWDYFLDRLLEQVEHPDLLKEEA